MSSPARCLLPRRVSCWGALDRQLSDQAALAQSGTDGVDPGGFAGSAGLDYRRSGLFDCHSAAGAGNGGLPCLVKQAIETALWAIWISISRSMSPVANTKMWPSAAGWRADSGSGLIKELVRRYWF